MNVVVSMCNVGVRPQLTNLFIEYEYMAIFVKIDRHGTSGRFKRAGGM